MKESSRNHHLIYKLQKVGSESLSTDSPQVHPPSPVEHTQSCGCKDKVNTTCTSVGHLSSVLHFINTFLALIRVYETEQSGTVYSICACVMFCIYFMTKRPCAVNIVQKYYRSYLFKG